MGVGEMVGVCAVVDVGSGVFAGGGEVAATASRVGSTAVSGVGAGSEQAVSAARTSKMRNIPVRGNFSTGDFLSFGGCPPPIVPAGNSAYIARSEVRTPNTCQCEIQPPRSAFLFDDLGLEV